MLGLKTVNGQVQPCDSYGEPIKVYHRFYYIVILRLS